MLAPSLHSVVELTKPFCAGLGRVTRTQPAQNGVCTRSVEQLLDLTADFQPALPEIVPHFVAEGIEL